MNQYNEPSVHESFESYEQSKSEQAVCAVDKILYSNTVPLIKLQILGGSNVYPQKMGAQSKICKTKY